MIRERVHGIAIVVMVVAACVAVTAGFVELYFSLRAEASVPTFNRETVGGTEANTESETKGSSVTENNLAPVTTAPEQTETESSEETTETVAETAAETEVTTEAPPATNVFVETLPPIPETVFIPVETTVPAGDATNPPPPDGTTAAPDDTEWVPVETTAPDWITTEIPAETTVPVETAPPSVPPMVGDTGGSYAVGSSARVDNSFFADAVFIGDSRTQGLQYFSDITTATYYAAQGLNVSTAQYNNFVYDNGEYLTVTQAVGRHPELKKIYISLGVNEFWMIEDTYRYNYRVLLDGIMAANPGATIYMYAVTPLFDGYFHQHSWNGLNNDKMARFNQIGREIASELGIYYVDVTEAFIKPDGRRYLDYNESSDGIHLTGYGINKLTEYLRTHTGQA